MAANVYWSEIFGDICASILLVPIDEFISSTKRTV
jgi:hypothetical protein